MEKIVFNDYNLIDKDIDTYVTRVKGLIFNSKGEVLLCHNNGTFQFPGGHLEKGEETDNVIIREIEEEIGIEVILDESPFLSIITYDNNYFNTGKKVLNTIYYYRIFSDEIPDFTRTHYDELEQKSDFSILYIDFKELSCFLQKSMEDGSIDINIGKEMLDVVEMYKKIYGGLK